MDENCAPVSLLKSCKTNTKNAKTELSTKSTSHMQLPVSSIPSLIYFALRLAVYKILHNLGFSY